MSEENKEDPVVEEPQGTLEPGTPITDEEALAVVEAARAEEAPTRDANGRFVSKQTDDDPDPEDGVEDQTEDEPDAGTLPNPARAQAVQDIQRVLDLPDSVLDAMSDEAIESTAEKARAKKAELDRQYAQARENRLEAGDPIPSQASSDQQEAPTGGQPSLDVDALLQPLKEELGDEAAESVKTLVASLTERVQAAEQYVQQTQAQQMARDEADARARVGERFPDVGDESAYRERILPKMQMLAKTGDYTGPDSFDRLIEDACRLAGSVQFSKDTESPASSRRAPARRTAGQHPTNGRAAERTLSDDEVDSAIIAAARVGDTARVEALRVRPR